MNRLATSYHKESNVESRLHDHMASSDVDWGKVTVK